MLLQTVSIPFNHVLLVAQRLSLFKDFGKLCARLIKLGVGFRKLIVSLGESFRFRLFPSDLCALTFQILFQLGVGACVDKRRNFTR